MQSPINTDPPALLDCACVAFSTQNSRCCSCGRLLSVFNEDIYHAEWQIKWVDVKDLKNNRQLKS